MRMTKKLMAKGPAGDIARLRQSAVEIAAVLDKTASMIRKGQATRELATELARGARALRLIVRLTRPTK